MFQPSGPLVSYADSSSCELTFASFSERVLVQNVSLEKSFCTKTHFDTEEKVNLKLAYSSMSWLRKPLIWLTVEEDSGREIMIIVMSDGYRKVFFGRTIFQSMCVDGDLNINPENVIYKTVQSQLVFRFHCAKRSSLHFLAWLVALFWWQLLTLFSWYQ